MESSSGITHDLTLEFVKKEEIFSTLLTPSKYGKNSVRWDTWRICHYNEILAFYGLAYWYTWQVTILDLGPIRMTKNEKKKQEAAKLIYCLIFRFFFQVLW